MVVILDEMLEKSIDKAQEQISGGTSERFLEFIEKSYRIVKIVPNKFSEISPGEISEAVLERIH